MRQRLQNVPQNVGLLRDTFQVRILLAVVIGHVIGLEKLRVLDGQLNRLIASPSGFQGGMQPTGSSGELGSGEPLSGLPVHRGQAGGD